MAPIDTTLRATDLLRPLAALP
uniref:Uncharacterized protein n=1 Tax=Arundo donax TaxID=35708 RepID=A0A0A9HRD7_ARUDO